MTFFSAYSGAPRPQRAVDVAAALPGGGARDRALLGEEPLDGARVVPSLHERLELPELLVQGNVWLYAFHDVLLERAPAAHDRRRAAVGRDDQFRPHGIVERQNPVLLVRDGVDSHPQPAGGVVGGDESR